MRLLPKYWSSDADLQLDIEADFQGADIKREASVVATDLGKANLFNDEFLNLVRKFNFHVVRAGINYKF